MGNFITVCVQTIEHAQNEEFDYIIELPNGISKTAGEICEGLRLLSFLELAGQDGT